MDNECLTRRSFGRSLRFASFAPHSFNVISQKRDNMLHLSADAKANYDRFVRRVKESNKVWGLKSPEGWAVCPSNEYENTTVYPFWSDEAYAKRHCINEWSNYWPASIDLDSFIDSWLKGMHEDGALVGANWNSDLAGLEIEPIDLAKLLIDES